MATFAIRTAGGQLFHTCVCEVADAFVHNPVTFGYSYRHDDATAEAVRSSARGEVLELLQQAATEVDRLRRRKALQIGRLLIDVQPGFSSPNSDGWHGSP